MVDVRQQRAGSGEAEIDRVCARQVQDGRRRYPRRTADDHIAKAYPDKIGLLDTQAKWRADGPSEKQIDWLLKKGVFPSRAEVPPTLTKGQASQLLDEAFAKRGRGR